MFDKLFDKLEIKPKNIDLYLQALTHSSYANENESVHYERLEFLGDAIIELIVSEYLYGSDDSAEGILTKRRAQCVREEALCLYANSINLWDYILLGRGEIEKSLNPSILADAFEALIAAIYLDLGYPSAKKVFLKLFLPLVRTVEKIKDYKTVLQELFAVNRKSLTYDTTYVGPPHIREFTAEVYLEGNILLGTGKGSTKKEAEQQAAKQALAKQAKKEL